MVENLNLKNYLLISLMETHRFWQTQPIININNNIISESGPLEIIQHENIKKEPYNLPDGYEWYTLNLDKDLEQICEFLNNNYLEDLDANYRFAYSKESIKWILECPNYFPELFICVRLSSNKKIVATIFGIPMDVKVYDKIIKQVEINLLCIDKKLRSKRLAPVLIKEVTRRTNLINIFQAVYTANLDLPNKLCSVQYYHRFINIKKLNEIGFINNNNLNITSLEKLYRIETNKLNIRPIKKDDIDICLEKLNNKLSKYNLTHIFNRESFEHYFMSKENIIYTYVVEKNNIITDMISFFIIDNKVINNLKHQNYKTAYLYYYFNEENELSDLINECLVIAKNKEIDLFNILNMFDLDTIIKKCKFVPGSGYLNYYLYNYKCPVLKSNEIALPIF